MNNLALTEYVDLINDYERKKDIRRLLIAFVILNLIYLFGPFIFKFFHSSMTKRVLYAIYIILMGGVTYHFCKTTKTVKHKVKQGWLWILTVFFYLFWLVMPILSELSNKIATFKFSFDKTSAIWLTAISAGVIEEFLFRGLLFNICLEYFAKSKYKFIWTTIITSILFSLMHLVNAIHQSMISTIGQILFAFGYGMLFSYGRLITNGISIGVFLHIWQDASPQIITNNLGNTNIRLIFPLALTEMAFSLLCVYFYNKKYNQQFGNTEYDTKSTEFDVNAQE